MFENQTEDKALYGLIDDSIDGSRHGLNEVLAEDITQVQNGSYERISGKDEWLMDYMKALFPNETNESLNYNYFHDLDEDQHIESSANLKVDHNLEPIQDIQVLRVDHNLEPIERIIEVVDQKRRSGRPKTVVEKKARRGRPPIEDIKEKNQRKKLSAKTAARKYRRKRRDQLLCEQQILSYLSQRNNDLKQKLKNLEKNKQILSLICDKYRNKLNKKQKLQFFKISKKSV